MATATEITIGGSEAAAACGIDPYRSRVELWLEKTGRIERPDAGEAARWGTKLEPLLLAELVESGWTLTLPADEFRHAKHGFLTGHVDALGVPPGEEETGVVECKTTSAYLHSAWDDEQVPPAYVVQAQHYLALTGLSFAVVACLIGGQRFVTRKVPRDEALIGTMLGLEREFVGLVERDEPPPPDGSESAANMLRFLYPEARAGVATLTSAEYAMVEGLRKLKRQEKKVAAAITEHEQALKARLGELGAGQFEGQVCVRWGNVTQTRLDQTKLREEDRATWEKYARKVTYRRFTIH